MTVPQSTIIPLNVTGFRLIVTYTAIGGVKERSKSHWSKAADVDSSSMNHVQWRVVEDDREEPTYGLVAQVILSYPEDPLLTNINTNDTETYGNWNVDPDIRVVTVFLNSLGRA